MLPAAPPRFSTITDWPSETRKRSVRMRASTSAGPAAGNGTTSAIGRVGKACAAALRNTDGTKAAPAAKWRKRRRGRFTAVPPRNCLHQPRPEERAPELVEGCARLEGWPQARPCPRPSFETAAQRARPPQDEVRGFDFN